MLYASFESLRKVMFEGGRGREMRVGAHPGSASIARGGRPRRIKVYLRYCPGHDDGPRWSVDIAHGEQCYVNERPSCLFDEAAR